MKKPSPRKPAKGQNNKAGSGIGSGPDKKTSAKPARHSATSKQPVTIDLKADKVSSKTAETKSVSSTTGPKVKSKPAASATANAGKDHRTGNEKKKPEPTASNTRQTGTGGSDAGASKPKQPPMAATKPKAGSSGFFGKLAAAIVGGIIALGGAGFLQYAGILGTPGNGTVSVAKVEVLEQENTSLNDRLATLEGEVKAVRETAGTTEDQVGKAIEERLIPANERLTGVEESLASIRTSVDELQKSVTSGLAEDAASAASLAARLSDLSSRVGNAEAGGGGSSIDTAGIKELVEPALNQLKGQVQELDTRFSSLNEAVKNLLGADEKLAGAVSSLQEVQSNTTGQLTALKSEITTQSETLNTLKAEVGDESAEEKAALALAATALKARIDTGQSFSDNLNVVRGLAKDGVDLAALEPLAEKGIPTIPQLQNSFSSVGEAILAATQPSGNDSGTFDKIFSSARSLVKVKPLGPVEGDSPQALVARIADDLKTGKLEQAETAWQALPEAGKKASESWHEGLRARLEANGLMQSLVEKMLAKSANQG